MFITQDATLLDVHIRKLAGKHFHVKRLFGTESSTVFEYNKFESKPEDPNTIKKAVSSPVWKFDKETYAHYKSAEIHTVKRKIPFKLLVFPFVAVLAIIVFVFAGRTLYRLANKDAQLVEEITSGVQGDTAAGASSDASPVTTVEQWVRQRTPIVKGIPWTAPMYNDVQEVKTFPKPHCIIFGQTEEDPHGHCHCYSQQITLMDVNDFVCRDLTARGWFDATQEIKETRASQASPDLRGSNTDRKPLRRDRGNVEFRGKVNTGDPRPPVGQAIRIQSLRPKG